MWRGPCSMTLACGRQAWPPHAPRMCGDAKPGLAKLAGGSTGTISRVLSHNPTVQVSVATRVHVTNKDLQYRPNLSARALRTNKISMIGLIVPRLTTVRPPVTELALYAMPLILAPDQTRLPKLLLGALVHRTFTARCYDRS